MTTEHIVSHLYLGLIQLPQDFYASQMILYHLDSHCHTFPSLTQYTTPPDASDPFTLPFGICGLAISRISNILKLSLEQFFLIYLKTYLP